MKIKELRKNSKSIILQDGTLIEDCDLPSDIASELKPIKYWDYNIDKTEFTFDSLQHEDDAKSLVEANNTVILKKKQEVLIDAYKSWETRVIRNLESLNSAIDAWYINVLNLVESSLENIPERVLFYISANNKELYEL